MTNYLKYFYYYIDYKGIYVLALFRGGGDTAASGYYHNIHKIQETAAARPSL